MFFGLFLALFLFKSEVLCYNYEIYCEHINTNVEYKNFN